MSREERTKQQAVTVVHCDFCTEEKSWGHPKACANGCGQDVCYSCGEDDPTDFGDYVSRYCPPCWALEGRAIYFDYITTSGERGEFLRDKWREAARIKSGSDPAG